MPRSSNRLAEIIRAALAVFMEKGYRRTQMADVAREMGVSPGTLYNYVEGKEALFHLLIDQAFLDGPIPAPPALSIRTPPPGATLERVRERLIAGAALPKLEAALSRQRVADSRGELEEIVRELYGVIERDRQAITLIERSALDLPELARLFYFEARRSVLSRLERYVEIRTRRGDLGRVPSPAAAARLILETAAWFAMHRHRDPDAIAIDDQAARETVVHFLVNALAPVEVPRIREQ
jgi:AcrR family transcriptional regulator